MAEQDKRRAYLVGLKARIIECANEVRPTSYDPTEWQLVQFLADQTYRGSVVATHGQWGVAKLVDGQGSMALAFTASFGNNIFMARDRLLWEEALHPSGPDGFGRVAVAPQQAEPHCLICDHTQVEINALCTRPGYDQMFKIEVGMGYEWICLGCYMGRPHVLSGVGSDPDLEHTDPHIDESSYRITCPEQAFNFGRCYLLRNYGTGGTHYHEFQTGRGKLLVGVKRTANGFTLTDQTYLFVESETEKQIVPAPFDLAPGQDFLTIRGEN
jgi:hypothetical protein